MASRSAGKPSLGMGWSSASRPSRSTPRMSRAHTEKGNCPALTAVSGAPWGAASGRIPGAVTWGSVSRCSA